MPHEVLLPITDMNEKKGDVSLHKNRFKPHRYHPDPSNECSSYFLHPIYQLSNWGKGDKICDFHPQNFQGINDKQQRFSLLFLLIVALWIQPITTDIKFSGQCHNSFDDFKRTISTNNLTKKLNLQPNIRKCLPCCIPLNCNDSNF